MIVSTAERNNFFCKSMKIHVFHRGGGLFCSVNYFCNDQSKFAIEQQSLALESLAPVMSNKNFFNELSNKMTQCYKVTN